MASRSSSGITDGGDGDRVASFLFLMILMFSILFVLSRLFFSGFRGDFVLFLSCVHIHNIWIHFE